MKGPSVGQIIAHYEILERLGGGGMGVVYTARDTRLGRIVALKFLTPDLTRDPDAKARFKREAQAASALDHKNICTIHAIEEVDDGGLFIAMACYDGETIKSRLERGDVSPAEALDLVTQIAEGLARAHGAGITHRDIKPANVLITRDGEVKILDFGLAKMAGQSQLTQTGSTVGTIAYMSPEQARGDDVDVRTDVWSLGVVLYELLTGRRPFRGDYQPAVIYSIINEDPEPVRAVNPQIEAELERIVQRALHKDVDQRYADAAEMLASLTAYREALQARDSGVLSFGMLWRRVREPRVAASVVGLVLLLGLATAWIVQRESRIRWATQVALPQVEQLVENSWRDYTDAYALAEEVERYIPDHPQLGELLTSSSVRMDIRSQPEGADVFMKPYDSPEREWKRLGITPVESLRVPIGVFRWRMEKDGFEPVEFAASSWDINTSGSTLLKAAMVERTLDEVGMVPEGMVRVTGTDSPEGRIDDFFIDLHEVTNAQFKAFVDAGGYRNPAYWRHEFVHEGAVLAWEDAMALFVDRTGRQGPSTWEAGDYLDGESHHPVSGVSWYEAAAYAEFAGKRLPTGAHWGRARGDGTPVIRWPQLGGYAIFAPFSNFGSDGPVAVGSIPGITSFGAYDMAGNVREWCWNETPMGRLLRGGAWDDNIYRFNQPAQAPPMDRSAKNGIRLALYPNEDSLPEPLFAPTSFGEPPNFYKIEPVNDEIFEVYKAQFDYDETPLNAEIESRDDTADDWIHERISVDAAYGDERLILHLFLPTNAASPHQAVIYFPGSASLYQESSENITAYYEFPVFLSFLLKGGRAVVYPVYDATFDRRDMDGGRVHTGSVSHEYTEYLIRWVKDFKRSIDYLETREDIDRDKLAFYGMSWGGVLAPIITAVEDRLHASIIAPGALSGVPVRPEVDPINYLSRVRVPTLMLNGRYDTRLTLDHNIRPMYDLLGTPDEHKALKLYDTDHIPPRSEYIKEMLAWLDRYLGPVH